MEDGIIIRPMIDLILAVASLFFWRKYLHKDFLWLAIISFISGGVGFLKNFIYNSSQISIELKLISSKFSIIFSIVLLILILKIAYKHFWKHEKGG